VCARVGNQRSRGVVTTRVRTDAQCRDLHQSTYSYLSEDRDSSYYQWGSLEFGLSSLWAGPNLIGKPRWCAGMTFEL
jgi:hypothetical protein